MSQVIRSELLKLRTARWPLGLAVGMLAMLTVVVLVHGLVLPQPDLDAEGQRQVFGLSGLGAVFAALLGAMSITAEFRTGTIRPTLLATPRRGRVLAAKAVTAAAAGTVMGAVASAWTIAVAHLALGARDVPVLLDGGDYAQLLVGGTAGAALWAVIGLGVGAVIRDQVATIAMLCAWLLFVESVLLSQLPEVIRYFPGTASAAIAGSTISGATPGPELLPPVLGACVLAGYAAAAVMTGRSSLLRRDVP